MLRPFRQVVDLERQGVEIGRDAAEDVEDHPVMEFLAGKDEGILRPLQVPDARRRLAAGARRACSTRTMSPTAYFTTACVWICVVVRRSSPSTVVGIDAPRIAERQDMRVDVEMMPVLMRAFAGEAAGLGRAVEREDAGAPGLLHRGAQFRRRRLAGADDAAHRRGFARPELAEPLLHARKKARDDQDARPAGAVAAEASVASRSCVICR